MCTVSLIYLERGIYLENNSIVIVTDPGCILGDEELTVLSAILYETTLSRTNLKAPDLMVREIRPWE